MGSPGRKRGPAMKNRPMWTINDSAMIAVSAHDGSLVSFPARPTRQPQYSSRNAPKARHISKRALGLSSHHSNLYQGAVLTAAWGASTTFIAGGNGYGGWQYAANSEIE